MEECGSKEEAFILYFILVKKKDLSVFTAEGDDSFWGRVGVLRFTVKRLTLNKKGNTLFSENGGNEERIDTSEISVWMQAGQEARRAQPNCLNPAQPGQPGEDSAHSSWEHLGSGLG